MLTTAEGKLRTMMKKIFFAYFRFTLTISLSFRLPFSMLFVGGNYGHYTLNFQVSQQSWKYFLLIFFITLTFLSRRSKTAHEKKISRISQFQTCCTIRNMKMFTSFSTQPVRSHIQLVLLEISEWIHLEEFWYELTNQKWIITSTEKCDNQIVTFLLCILLETHDISL